MLSQVISDHRLKTEYVPAHELSKAEFEAARAAIHAELQQQHPFPPKLELKPFDPIQKRDLELRLKKLEQQIVIAETLTNGQYDKSADLAETKATKDALGDLDRAKTQNEFIEKEYEAAAQEIRKARWAYLAVHYTHLLDTEYIGVEGFGKDNSFFSRQTSRSGEPALLLHLFESNFHRRIVDKRWVNAFDILSPSAPNWVAQDYPELLRQPDPDPDPEPEREPAASKPPRKPDVERQVLSVYNGTLSIGERYPDSHDRQLDLRLIDDTDRGYQTRLNYNDLRFLVTALKGIANTFEGSSSALQNACIVPRWCRDDELILREIDPKEKHFLFELISYEANTDTYRRAATLIFQVELTPLIAALEVALDRISPHAESQE